MPKSNFFPVVLLLGLFIAFHVHARESQFFSKFTANFDANPVGPSNEPSESLEKQSQDSPLFVAETQNGFGLYGHESGQLPPSDTDSTSFSDESYYNKDVFATEDETAGDTKAMLQGSSYDSAAVNGQNNYFPGQSYGNVVANGRNNYYAVGNQYVANDDNNVHRQQQQQQQEEEGMSDTRFVENEKYYNANDEEKYNPARYPDSRNAEFNNNKQAGYYGDSYEAAAAGGYEPVKDMNEFRATKNVEEFMPSRFVGGIN